MMQCRPTKPEPPVTRTRGLGSSAMVERFAVRTRDREGEIGQSRCAVRLFRSYMRLYRDCTETA